MRLARILLVANLLCWLLFLVMREPMPAAYFSGVDDWRLQNVQRGHFSMVTDHPFVLAERGIGGWGERASVHALVWLSAGGFIPAVFTSTVLETFTAMSSRTISYFAAITLVGFLVLQWYFIGLFAEFIRSRRAA